VFWEERPRLRPLLSLVDEYENTVIALVDKKTARIFRVFLDRIEELADVRDAVHGHHEKGAEAQSNMARHTAEELKRHLRHVCNVLSQITGREGVARIVLGGTPEALAELDPLLPRPLRDRRVGEFHCAMYSSPDEVLAQARAALQAAERAHEIDLVDQVLEARGRGLAVFGLPAVAPAVAAGQVLQLLADADQRFTGYVCSRCAQVQLNRASRTCPACGGPLTEQPDVIECLAARVLQQGGQFEELRAQAAERLVPAGSVAALLRYRVPPTSDA
jgi:peptide subunit release factor 1 (eRF1)